MKIAAQRIKTPDTIELVPQILHLKRILVPTDFSETSKKAVQYALRFAEQFGCEIAFLYVVEPATTMRLLPEVVERVLREANLGCIRLDRESEIQIATNHIRFRRYKPARQPEIRKH